jgi:chromosome segregation ATPase
MSKLREKLLELCQFKLDEQRQKYELQIAELQSKYDAAYGIIRSLEAKLAAAEAALAEIREWCVIAEREKGLIGPVRTRLRIDAARGEKL